MKNCSAFIIVMIALCFLLSIPELCHSADKGMDSGERFEERFKSIEIEKGENVNFYGETLDYLRDDNLLIGRGAVDIEYEGMNLQADYVEYNLETADVKARGNVVVEDGSSVLFCEEINFNIKTKIGVIYNGEVFLEPTYYLTGVEIRRLGLERYKVIKGYYTACQAEVPAWSIKTSEADAEVNGLLKAKDSSFQIKHIPVLYSPLLYFPLKKDRSTGFLLPKVGYSQRKGARWKQPFFWAFNDYSDATFTADMQGKNGLAGELNFNYLIDKDSSGAANAYYISQKNSSSSNSNGGNGGREDRWNIFLFHKQELGNGMRIVGKIDAKSDQNFNQDFGESEEERSRGSDTKLDAYVTLSKSWDRYFYEFGAARHDERIKSFPKLLNDGESTFHDVITKKTYQYLPNVQFVALEQPVFGNDGLIKGLDKLNDYLPVKFRLDSSFASMRSKVKSKDYTVDTTDVQNFDQMRLDFHPQVILPVNIKDILTVTTKLGIRETFYTNRNTGDNKDKTFSNDGTLKKVNLSDNSDATRELFDLNIRADGPAAYAVMKTGTGDLQKIKHVIQPSIEYSYIPNVRQRNKILQGDDLDFIRGREYLKWILANSFYGNFAGTSGGEDTNREIARLSLSQFYDFEKDNGKYRRLIESKQRFRRQVNNTRALSDMNIDLDLFPYQGTQFSFSGYVDPVDSDLDRVVASMRVSRDMLGAKTTFSLSTRWTSPLVNQTLDWDEPDFNPLFDFENPYDNVFTSLKFDMAFPAGWEFGYLARFYNTQKGANDFLDTDLFDLKQREYNLRIKYIAQCWSVEGTYGVREYFREGHSLLSKDDSMKDDQFFWLLVELKTLGEISSLGM